MNTEAVWALVTAIVGFLAGLLKQNRDLTRAVVGITRNTATSNERLAGLAKQNAKEHGDIVERIDDIPSRNADEFDRRNRRETA